MRHVTRTASALTLIASVAAAAPTAAAVAPRARHATDQLVYSRYFADGSVATRIIGADGAHGHTIIDQAGSPHWSPDGNRIVIAPCSDPETVPSCPEIISPTGTVLERLPIPPRFRPADVTFWQPEVWSPDGRRLAGAADSTDVSLNGVYTVRAADGRGLRRLTTNPRGVDIPGAYGPKGRRLAFTRGNDATSTGIGVFLVRASGGGVERVTPKGLEVNDDPGLVDWSPDGRRIAFAARPSADNRFTLYTVRPDGTHLTQVPVPLACGASFEDPRGLGCTAPSWSPDSRTLAFDVFHPDTLLQEIDTVRVDGTHLHRLTSGGFFDEGPDWRPRH